MARSIKSPEKPVVAAARAPAESEMAVADPPGPAVLRRREMEEAEETREAEEEWEAAARPSAER